jgi:hypothetical protein
MRVRSAYKNKKKIKRNWKPLLWLVFVIVLIVILTYILFFSPYLRINRINAQGTDKVKSSDLAAAASDCMQGRLLKIFPKNNFFLVSGNKLADSLRVMFKDAKNIAVVKKFPSSVIISANDRQKVVVYCNQPVPPVPGNASTTEAISASQAIDGGQGKCYWADEEGVIFEEAPEIYGGKNITIRDNSGRQVSLGDKVLESGLILFLQKAGPVISTKNNLNIVNYQINAYPTATIYAVTSDGWKIIFDLGSDLETQADALQTVLDEKIKGQRNQLEYVDLRARNRVYYKMK